MNQFAKRVDIVKLKMFKGSGLFVTCGTKKGLTRYCFYKINLSIVIIEAKDNKHSIDHGIQQAIWLW